MTDTPAPPVSPDPWKDVDEDHEGKCWMDDVNKARAADALRHQQETTALQAEVQRQKDLMLKQTLLGCEFAQEREDARAALSTAEATIASLTAERDAAQQEKAARKEELSEALKQAEWYRERMAEANDALTYRKQEAQTLREAATWVAYVAGGVGLAGGYPEPGEAEEAMKALVAALSSSPRPQEPQPMTAASSGQE